MNLYYKFFISLLLYFTLIGNSYSQIFTHSKGSFEKSASSWVEKTKEGRIFYFKEYSIDENFYYLKDDSRGTELQIPILGGWANIKSGEYTTMGTDEKDPITGQVYFKKKGGGGPIWNKLYYLTAKSNGQKTNYSSDNKVSNLKNKQSASQEVAEKLIIPQQRNCFRCGKSIKLKSSFYSIEYLAPNNRDDDCYLRQRIYNPSVSIKRGDCFLTCIYGNDYNTEWMNDYLTKIYCNKICAVKYAQDKGIELKNY